MAKTSFNKAAQAAPVTTEQVADKAEVAAIVAAEEQKVVVSANAPIGSVSGEVETSDIAYPQLKLAQSVGPLMEDFNRTPGEIVLKNEINLWMPNTNPPSAPVRISVLKAEKVFIEDTENGSDVKPRYFNTKEEADAAGLRTEWENGEKPEVSPLLRTVILIEESDKTEGRPEFYITMGGKNYALAVWSIGGTAYRAAAREIITESQQSLRTGLHKGIFGVSAVKVKGKANSYWTPQVKLLGTHSPEVVAEIEKMAI